jgi:uncharacterized protein (DUF302 family)
VAEHSLIEEVMNKVKMIGFEVFHSSDHEELCLMGYNTV